MPTYDYVCSSCGNEMEVVHPVHGEGPTVCPKCGGALRKTFAPPAVHFKGSGWARKDRSAAGRPSKSASRADSKGESKEGDHASGGDPGSSTSSTSPSTEAD